MLIMVTLSFIGMAIIPTLDISYTPKTPEKIIGVSFSWPGVSERIVENEATSKLEGVLSGMRNCTRVRSVSSFGGGRVDLRFKKKPTWRRSVSRWRQESGTSILRCPKA